RKARFHTGLAGARQWRPAAARAGGEGPARPPRKAAAALDFHAAQPILGGDPCQKEARPLSDTAEAATTVDTAEISRFSALAAKWWDESGPMRPLHRLNPTRLAWIKKEIAVRFGRDPKDAEALAGLRILDIGCGAGILAEPLARMGGAVVAIDPSAELIEAAKLHA